MKGVGTGGAVRGRKTSSATTTATTLRVGNTRFMAPHTAIALATALPGTDPEGVSAAIERAADEMTLLRSNIHLATLIEPHWVARTSFCRDRPHQERM